MTAQPGARRRSGYALVAFAASSWGTWPLILRNAPIPAALQSAILMSVITIVSLPLMAKDRMRVRARPVHWLGVSWLGVSDALNIGLFFAAYQRTSVAIAVLTHCLTPVFVAIGAPLVLGEPLRARTAAAVAVSFSGLVLLLEPWRDGLSAGDVAGAALGTASAVFYASNVFVNKRLAHVFSGSEMMFFHGVVAVPLLWTVVPHGALFAASPTSIGAVVLGSLGPGAVSGLLFVWGLRRIDASHASILTLLEPFVAVLLAALILGQRLGGIPTTGAALILIGAVAVVTARTQPVQMS